MPTLIANNDIPNQVSMDEYLHIISGRSIGKDEALYKACLLVWQVKP